MRERQLLLGLILFLLLLGAPACDAQPGGKELLRQPVPTVLVFADPAPGNQTQWRRWRDLCLADRQADLHASVRAAVHSLTSRFFRNAEASVFTRDFMRLLLLRRGASEHNVQRSGQAVAGTSGSFATQEGQLCWTLDRDNAEWYVKKLDLLTASALLSRYRSTDQLLSVFVKLLRMGLDSPSPALPVVPLLRRVLLLLSPLNPRELFEVVSPTEMFSHDMHMLCYWFTAYFSTYTYTLGDETGMSNLRLAVDNREWLGWWQLFDERLNTVYYVSSYIDNDRDGLIKQHINHVLRDGHNENQWLADTAKHVSKRRRAQKKYTRLRKEGKAIGRKHRISVLVVTQFWFKRHSVYRTLARYVEALQRNDRFHVELGYLSRYQHDAVTTGFAKVTNFFDDSDHNIAIAVEKYCRYTAKGDKRRFKFDIVFFPDVGMSWPSMYVANRRLAPVMVAGVGHSVSSHGSFVDYYIAGDQAVLPRGESEALDAQYSETLLLLPGAGVVHNPVEFKPDPGEYRLPAVVKRRDRLFINCPFSAQKVSHTFLKTIKQILARADFPITLRFFPHVQIKIKAAAFEHVLRRSLGLTPNSVHRAAVYPHTPYEEYMGQMQKGHLFIEPFHYGGCNTAVDALVVGLPFVAWEGRHWHNRIGAQIIRQAGLEAELVTKSRDEYVDRVVQLINRPAELARVTKLVRDVPLDSLIFDDSARTHIVEGDLHSLPEPAYFPLALQYLHELEKPKPRGPDSPRPKQPIIYLRDVLNERKRRKQGKTEL